MGWSYSYSSEVWPALLTLALVVYLGMYSWQRRDIPAARPFTLVCVLGVCWTAGVILEILSVSLPVKVFWLQFQAVWHLPAVTAVTCFIVQYADLGRFLTLRNYVLLSLVPLAGAAVMMTNDFHHLMWTGFRMNGQIVMSPGRLYWGFVGYGYAISLVNVVILLRLAIFSPRHRLPVAIILGSQVVARIAYAIDKLHPDLIGSGEKVLLVVGLMALAYALAFLRFHAIDPVAAARNIVLDQMREGVYVLDCQWRIVYTNPMAAAISGMSDRDLRQRHIAEVMPVDVGFLDQMERQGIHQSDVALGKDHSERRYNLLLAPLKGRKKELIGKLLLLRDITEQWRAQNRIMEQQRKVAKLQEREHLARELHDGIGQILGYVSIQVQTARTWMRNGNLEKAGVVLDRSAEMARDAHADIRESILTLRTGSEKKKPFLKQDGTLMEKEERT